MTTFMAIWLTWFFVGFIGDLIVWKAFNEWVRSQYADMGKLDVFEPWPMPAINPVFCSVLGPFAPVASIQGFGKDKLDLGFLVRWMKRETAE